MFQLSIHNTVLRYYLMMVVAVVAVYAHQNWLILLAFAIGVSAILGMRIGRAGEKAETRVVPMGESRKQEHRKAG